MVTSVPNSEAEVFEQYFPHVKFLVARAGIRPDYVEDYAMNLMIKFLEKGILNQYNPDRETVVEGVKRTASFKTYLSGFVNSYLRHFKERDNIHKDRSRISTDMNVSLGDNEVPLLDYFGVFVSDNTDRIEAREIIEHVKMSVSEHPRLSLFFDFVILQVIEHGKIDVAELSELFDVTKSTIHNWLAKLRVEFDKCQ